MKNILKDRHPVHSVNLTPTAMSVLLKVHAKPGINAIEIALNQRGTLRTLEDFDFIACDLKKYGWSLTPRGEEWLKRYGGLRK